MCLIEAPNDVELKVVAIQSDNRIKRKLNSMGIHIDDMLIKMRSLRWEPVLVKNIANDGLKLALDKELAEKIIVHYAR